MSFEIGENRLIPHKLNVDNVTVSFRVHPEGTKDTITTTSAQLITILRYIPNTGSLTVFLNGVFLKYGVDYTEPAIAVNMYSTTLLLSNAPPIGGVLVVIHGSSILNEGVNYRRINSRIVQLTQLDADDYPIIGGNVWGQVVDWGAQNPTRFIDKRTGEDSNLSSIVDNVEFWHPAQGYHYSIGWQSIDLFHATDPAKYTNSENPDQLTQYSWREEKMGVSWLDMSEMVYKPYYDDKIFANFDLRKKIWGQLSDWTSIKLYQWIKSDVPPDAWDELAIAEEGNINIPPEIRKTGRVRKLVYKNIADDPENDTPIWLSDETMSERFDPLIDGIPYGTRTYAFTTSFDPAELVNIYVNGFVRQEDVAIGGNKEIIVHDVLDNDIVDIVHEEHEPTDEDLENNLYKYDYPYTETQTFGGVTPIATINYYFWVQNTTVAATGKIISLFQATKDLTDIPVPFIFFSKFEQAEVVTEANNELHLPARFEQATAVGLRGRVKSDRRYTLRFTRDFTLRDSLEEGDSPLQLKDKHTEWRLMRREQTSKVNRELWNKITECIVGFKLDSPSDSIPSLQRLLYDEQYDTQTQYGFGGDQAFTNGTLALQTILNYLTSGEIDFTPLDIDTFFKNYSFETPDAIIEAMDIVYNTFPTQNVNDIYFRVLLDAMSVKDKYEGIFKTSYIALTGVRILETEVSTV